MLREEDDDSTETRGLLAAEDVGAFEEKSELSGGSGSAYINICQATIN